jgi:hypothetical protein
VTPILRVILLVLALSMTAPATRALDANGSPPPSSSGAPPASATTNILWTESFAGHLDWRDPQEHRAALIGRVYSVQQEGGLSFLRGHHDAASKGAPPAIHFGKAFDGIPLSRVRLLRWRWRASTQPVIRDDAWEDMAASIYVVTRAPSLLRKGRGFKFGWLAKPGPSQTYQRGILQVPLRIDPPGPQWRTEEVELCALYRRTYGACEDAQIIYIGVLTDADGVKSTARGDYAGFELIGSG